MTRRKQMRLLAGLLVLAGFSLMAITACGHRISEWSYWSIREGMTEEQVIAVFGVPAGCYRNGLWEDARQWRRYAERDADELLEALKVHEVVPERAAWGQATYKTWISDCCVFDVYFDGHGRVITPWLTPLRDVPAYVRVRWWFYCLGR